MGSKSDNPPLIAIVGETASGKTAAAIKLALEVGGEIICADSRTVYKYLDIGTAKPTKEEQAIIPHHLINILEPTENFTVAEFKRRAEKCIQDISQRGKIPILVGGTGLYVDALLYNFQFNNKADMAQRTQLLQMSDEKLTTLLSTKNIDTSSLNTKNRRHVIRAIETGGINSRRSVELRKNTFTAGLSLNRTVLEQRIKARVDKMFDSGFSVEVGKLLDRYPHSLEAFKTPGYKAVIRHVHGEISEDEAKAAFVSADLKLAKRQRTWFKRNQDIQWFEDPALLIQKAVEFTNPFNYNKT